MPPPHATVLDIMNNLSARLRVNQMLRDTGLPVPSADLSYTEYATELRKLLAPKQDQVPFTERTDAVRYLQLVASGAISLGG